MPFTPGNFIWVVTQPFPSHGGEILCWGEAYNFLSVTREGKFDVIPYIKFPLHNLTHLQNTKLQLGGNHELDHSHFVTH